MDSYIVTLKEYADDKFTFIFHCEADDADHAEEQALNAYPDHIIVDVTEIAWEKED